MDYMVDYWHAVTDEQAKSARKSYLRKRIFTETNIDKDRAKYGRKALDMLASALEDMAGKKSDQTMREVTIEWMEILDEIGECDVNNLEEEFGYLFDDDNDEDDGKMPEDYEEVDYVGQNVSADEIDCMMQDEELDAELKNPVTNIRMDYPFRVEGRGTYNVYKIEAAKTWRELVKAVMDVCKREYAAGHNDAPHALEDYVIEHVWVCKGFDGGLATVGIGS